MPTKVPVKVRRRGGFSRAEQGGRDDAYAVRHAAVTGGPRGDDGGVEQAVPLLPLSQSRCRTSSSDTVGADLTSKAMARRPFWTMKSTSLEGTGGASFSGVSDRLRNEGWRVSWKRCQSNCHEARMSDRWPLSNPHSFCCALQILFGCGYGQKKITHSRVRRDVVGVKF